MRLRRTALTGIGLSVLMLAGCANAAIHGQAAAEYDGVVKIGLLIPETGPYAPLGQDMRRAAETYLTHHQNTIAGQPAELVVADSAGNPETGKTRARQLALRDKVDVITGLVASPVAVTVAQEAKASQIPVVIANAGADALTGAKASEYVWRVSQSNYQHGYAAGVYAAEHVSTTGGVFMGADYAAGTETRRGFVAGYTAAGGQPLLAEILTPYGRTQNYQPFLSRVPADAKFIYAFYAGGEAITFQRNYEEFGYKDRFPLIGAQNLTDEDILPAVKDAGLGVTTVGFYAPALENEANRKLVNLWQQAYSARPSIIAVATYDAFTFIDAAAAKVSGEIGPATLVDAFPHVGEIDSPRGTFVVDPTTHNPVQNYYARTLEKSGNDYVNTVVATIPGVKG